MKALKSKTKKYLARLDERLGPFVPRTVSSLPLFLRERYSLYSAKLFGRNWLLAVEADDWDPGTPTEYRQHCSHLIQATGEKYVALVLPFVSATVRNRMVCMEIPFIIPDTQIFLPECLTFLSESYGSFPAAAGRPLSPPAQVLLLFQVLKGGVEELSAKELSARLGYSRASLSNATAELEQNHLCETCRKGKEQRIIFKSSGKALWEAGLPLLRSPLGKIHFINWTVPLPQAKLAGISALARRTLLADEPIPEFALPEKLVRQSFAKGHFNNCPDRHQADAQLEAWRYDPALLSDGPEVDPLSLSLSLRNNPDERVQAAIAEMMEEFPWR